MSNLSLSDDQLLAPLREVLPTATEISSIQSWQDKKKSGRCSFPSGCTQPINRYDEYNTVTLSDAPESDDSPPTVTIKTDCLPTSLVKHMKPPKGSRAYYRVNPSLSEIVITALNDPEVTVIAHTAGPNSSLAGTDACAVCSKYIKGKSASSIVWKGKPMSLRNAVAHDSCLKGTSVAFDTAGGSTRPSRSVRPDRPEPSEGYGMSRDRCGSNAEVKVLLR